MNETALMKLSEMMIMVAARAAHKYLDVHNCKPVSDVALANCLRSMVKVYYPKALADAKEAIDCGMVQIAEQTFLATMAQAGIEAAKECSTPE